MRRPWSNEGMERDRLSSPDRALLPAREGRALLERVGRAVRLDLQTGPPPSNARFVAATLVSLVLSLALDVVAVRFATAQFPSTRGFSHFRAADYGSLTVAGVLLAAGGWAVLVRVSSGARRVCFRLAVAATLVLWIPDAVLLALGESPKGVATLMVMHLLITLVTYNLLVRIAPPGPPPVPRAGGSGAGAGARRARLVPEQLVRRIWGTMALVVALDAALGVSVIVSVPFRRPAAILPARGIWIYAAHGAVGIALGVAALAILVLSPLTGRIGRIGAVMGAVGVVVGGAGGVFASFQQTRLLGMGTMLVGVVVAGIGYLAPSLEAMGKAEAARAEAARADRTGARARREARPRGRDLGDENVSSNGRAAPPPSG